MLLCRYVSLAAVSFSVEYRKGKREFSQETLSEEMWNLE